MPAELTISHVGPKSQDWSGRKFGMWTVLFLDSRTPRGVKMWMCECECGKRKPVSATSLPSGSSRSCGCDRDRKTIERSYKHGGAMRGDMSPEYKAWRDMMKRCFQKNFHHYPAYGGRGITVCERWREASNFIADIPKKPVGKFSLDRIDFNGNYEPGNVRWATDHEQSRNKRSNRMLTFDGVTLCLKDMAERFGFREHVVRKRLNRGWSVESALTIKLKL